METCPPPQITIFFCPPTTSPNIFSPSTSAIPFTSTCSICWSCCSKNPPATDAHTSFPFDTSAFPQVPLLSVLSKRYFYSPAAVVLIFVRIPTSALTYFPNPQFGKVQTGQFKHKPPSPSVSISAFFRISPATIRGRTKSKIVRFAYITHPGRPMTGLFFSP